MRYFSVGVLLTSLIVTLTDVASKDFGLGAMIIPSAEFAIPSDEIPRIEINALNGDEVAARKIYKYYMLSKNDYAQARFWLQIAAENGDPGAKVDMISLLRDDLPERDPHLRKLDRERVCFWVRNAYADKRSARGVYRGDLHRCGVK